VKHAEIVMKINERIDSVYERLDLKLDNIVQKLSNHEREIALNRVRIMALDTWVAKHETVEHSFWRKVLNIIGAIRNIRGGR